MFKKVFLLLALTTLICSSQAAAYSTSLAHKLVIASNIAFSSQTQIDQWTCQQCHLLPMKQTISFSNTVLNTSGYAGYLEQQNAIVVAFRDTSNIQNWIATLDFTQDPYPGCNRCLVHQGIYNMFQGIQGYLRSNIHKLHTAHSGSKIYFTGFGVGGALSTLAALDTKQILGQADILMTFGQPRVGNQAFANFVTSQIPERYRVICYADIVPQMPPQTPVPYSHFASEIWYDETMQKYKICGAEQFTCSKSLFPWKWTTNDHFPGKYEKLKEVTINENNLSVEKIE